MDWREANLSLQIAAEERIGSLIRLAQSLARSREDAAFEALKVVADGPR